MRVNPPDESDWKYPRLCWAWFGSANQPSIEPFGVKRKPVNVNNSPTGASPGETTTTGPGVGVGVAVGGGPVISNSTEALKFVVESKAM